LKVLLLLFSLEAVHEEFHSSFSPWCHISNVVMQQCNRCSAMSKLVKKAACCHIMTFIQTTTEIHKKPSSLVPLVCIIFPK
jgi:hypothetical protein